MPVNPKGKKRVLVIDDDQDVRSLFVETLEPKGFDVVTSADPDVGVEGARETEPDLIFISLFFPHSNGLKVSKAIHADDSLQKVPIVMLITYQGELDPKYTTTIGVVDVLVKPLNSKDILAKTVSLLGGEVVLPEIEKKPSGIPEGDETLIYSLEKEFADLDREEPALRQESPWDKEFTDLGKEDIVPGSGGEATLQSGTHEPAGGETGGFFDYEMEDEIAGKEGDIVSGQAKKDEERETRFGEENFMSEEEILPEPKKSLVRKIITAVGVVVIIAGVGIGALRLMSFFSSDSGIPAKKEVVKRDSLPKTAKPGESAPVPEAVKPEKSGSPAPTQAGTKNENSPAAPDTQKTVKEPVQTAAAERAQALKPLQKEEPAHPKADEPKAQKATTASTYSVQVGYFKEGKNAARLVETLKQKGYDAFLLEGNGETGKRVLIGKFSDRKKAQVESLQIQKNEGLKSMVYRY